MSETVKKSNRLRWAIVVDETELRRIDEIIRLSFNDSGDFKVVYTISCSDGSVIRLSEIDSVVNENNSNELQINYINANIYTEDYSKEINVTLQDGSAFCKSIDYSVTGDSRDWTYLTSSKLDDRFKNMKQWYTSVLKIDWWILIVPLMLFLSVFSSLYSNDVKPEASTTASYLEVVFVTILMIAFFLIVPTLLNKVTKYLFPLCVFRIGDGIKKHDRLISLRTHIFWSFLVAIAVSLAVNFIFL